MRRTCNYTESMSKMIQLRNVPDALHRKLKARAAMEGMSLSDYLLHEIRQSADLPTPAELKSGWRSAHRRMSPPPTSSLRFASSGITGGGPPRRPCEPRPGHLPPAR